MLVAWTRVINDYRGRIWIYFEVREEPGMTSRCLARATETALPRGRRRWEEQSWWGGVEVEVQNLILTCSAYDACSVCSWRCCVGRYVNLMFGERWDRTCNSGRG